MREEYSNNIRRWYDKDPILSRSMRTLELADDATQIQVALNIIKIIIEHNIAYSEYSSVEAIINAVDDGLVNQGRSRWYDIDKTLRTAITMLENENKNMQIEVAKEIAKNVLDKIKEMPEDTDEEEFDEDFDDDDDDNYDDLKDIRNNPIL